MSGRSLFGIRQALHSLDDHAATANNDILGAALYACSRDFLSAIASYRTTIRSDDVDGLRDSTEPHWLDLTGAQREGLRDTRPMLNHPHRFIEFVDVAECKCVAARENATHCQQ